MASDVRADDFRASIQSVAPAGEKKMQIVLRCANRASRALHYIADVRATRYDPATRTLTISLSDEGRQVLPTTVQQLPVIRHLDPGSEAEIRLEIPDRVIKLSRNAPPGQLAFEKHDLSDMKEVVVEVAWADVPFYQETRPRKKDTRQLPTVRWEQHKAKASMRLKSPE